MDKARQERQQLMAEVDERKRKILRDVEVQSLYSYVHTLLHQYIHSYVHGKYDVSTMANKLTFVPGKLNVETYNF